MTPIGYGNRANPMLAAVKHQSDTSCDSSSISRRRK
jgi:hypothetical protein